MRKNIAIARGMLKSGHPYVQARQTIMTTSCSNPLPALGKTSHEGGSWPTSRSFKLLGQTRATDRTACAARAAAQLCARRVDRNAARACGRKRYAHSKRQPNRLAGIARRASGDRPYKAGGRWTYHRNSARTLTPAPQRPAPPFSRRCDEDFVCCVDVHKAAQRPRSELAIGGALTPHRR